MATLKKRKPTAALRALLGLGEHPSHPTRHRTRPRRGSTELIDTYRLCSRWTCDAIVAEQDRDVSKTSRSRRRTMTRTPPPDGSRSVTVDRAGSAARPLSGWGGTATRWRSCTSAARPNAEEAVKEVEQAGGRAIAVQADVADETAVAALFDRTEQEFGGIDVVVNAAGIMPLAPTGRASTSTVFDRMYRTNSAAPSSSTSRRSADSAPAARIINISSSLTKLAAPELLRLLRHQGRRRGDHADPGPRVARPRRHRQRRGPRPDRDRLFFDGKSQELIDRIAAEPRRWSARPAVRHRRDHRLPGRPGALDQRPGHLRQRWLGRLTTLAPKGRP